MDFDHMIQENEIVLSYQQGDPVEPVILRYERALPTSMRQESTPPPDDPPSWRAMALRRQMARRKRRDHLIIVGLVLLLSLICLGAGLWYAQQGAQQSSLWIPYGQDRDPSTEEYYWNTYEESETEISIPRYPVRDDIRLELLSAGERSPLTADEIYAKVNPSVVTVLGEQGDYGSVGSGIIFDADGYILTNCHVIAGCSSCAVWISTAEGAIGEYEAKLVGCDEDTDLAILKVEADHLTVAEFGVSNELRVGDKVYAIGNPLGLELISTFTDGMVSAVDRCVSVDGLTMTLIQTNAALNNGNSGGPLINQYGQVVGINTIKMMSSNDTIEGLGFAIPTSIAVGWINELLTQGVLSPRPVLGLTISRISTQLPDGAVGLEVLEVSPGLGGERTGIRAGDYIVAFNDCTIYRMDQILAIRSTLTVGEKIPIRIFRNGRYLDLVMEMMAEQP